MLALTLRWSFRAPLKRSAVANASAAGVAAAILAWLFFIVAGLALHGQATLRLASPGLATPGQEARESQNVSVGSSFECLQLASGMLQ